MDYSGIRYHCVFEDRARQRGSGESSGLTSLTEVDRASALAVPGPNAAADSAQTNSQPAEKTREQYHSDEEVAEPDLIEAYC